MFRLSLYKYCFVDLGMIDFGKNLEFYMNKVF